MTASPHHRRLLMLAGAVTILALGAVIWASRSDEAPGPTAQLVVPTGWLGLNYNGEVTRGPLRAFSARGVVYDREGNIEVLAGHTLRSTRYFRKGLARAYSAGMIPDILVDSGIGPRGCAGNPDLSNLCLPRGAEQIRRYVNGFVATATSVLRAYPRHRALFEPMDEPWNWAWPSGTLPGTVAAGEYAAVLAPLLTAAKKASVSLNDIYVPALGALADQTSWIPDLYQARPCLEPGPRSCGPIRGWNLHPYGLPGSPTQGIGSVPSLRAEMSTGTNNVIVSEIGFCATTVDHGNGCNSNTPVVVGTGAQTATWLSETLVQAVPMHQAKWLKALIVWARHGGGWAMQNPNGSLTPQGRALMQFAASPLSH